METYTGPSTGQGAEGAGSAAQDVKEQAKEKANEARREARGRLSEQVDQRSTDAGEQVGSAADALRQASSQLREQGKESPARYVDQAADRMQRAGGWLRDSDGDALLRDVEDFSRRNPWAVVLGGVALGFAASRLLKASSADRYRSGGTSAGQLPRTTTPRTSAAPLYGNGGSTGVGVPPVPRSEAPPVTPPAPGTQRL